ncbi:hypothetical protein SDC9_114914 [bioreactor metagenome]|uniref:Uncharacterized protein n=1 Tax=bioreactor metagenome TaxID=1076179 RepID=A0A645BSD0_9ZZZZ
MRHHVVQFAGDIGAHSRLDHAGLLIALDELGFIAFLGREFAFLAGDRGLTVASSEQVGSDRPGQAQCDQWRQDRQQLGAHRPDRIIHRPAHRSQDRSEASGQHDQPGFVAVHPACHRVARDGYRDQRPGRGRDEEQLRKAARRDQRGHHQRMGPAQRQRQHDRDRGEHRGQVIVAPEAGTHQVSPERRAAGQDDRHRQIDAPDAAAWCVDGTVLQRHGGVIGRVGLHSSRIGRRSSRIPGSVGAGAGAGAGAAIGRMFAGFATVEPGHLHLVKDCSWLCRLLTNAGWHHGRASVPAPWRQSTSGGSSTSSTRGSTRPIIAPCCCSNA